MSQQENITVLNAAIAKILRRLANISLRNGLSYDNFAELAKHVFVEVAGKEFPIEGRKVSASRISTITGIPRKEVSRLMKLPWDSDAEVSEQRNRAARVLAAWVRDSAFHDRKGDPLDLPLEGSPSFSELVRQYSGDIPSRAIADELERLGAIEIVDGGKYRLLARTYVPAKGTKELLEILGSDTAELMDTIDHNAMLGDDEAPLLQMKVSYDNVPVEYVDAFQILSGRMGRRLIEDLDHWLADHDRDRNPDVLGSGKARLGLMVFQLQEIEQEGEGDGDEQ